MFFKKAKKLVAGACVAAMLFTSVGENALVAMAAEAEIVTEAAAVEDVSGADAGDVSAADVVDVSDSDVSVGDVSESDVVEVPVNDVTSGETSAPVEAGKDVSNDKMLATSSYTFDEATGTLTFSATVTGIGDNAFKYNKNADNASFLESIQHIKFEDGAIIKIIGNYAFMGLPNLESVDFSNCSKLTTIYKQAFSNCEKMEEVSFPDELQEIQASAFSSCKGLTSVTITPGLINIGASAFTGCTSLATVVVEAGNITCGNGIFSNCKIEDIQFAKDNVVVPSKLFYGAKFATVEDSGADAQIVIPAHIQEIGAGAFENCTTLKYVTIEDSKSKPSALASVGATAFKGCKKLDSVTFPASVKVIEASAYEGCEALAEVNIPNTVTSIGKAAFKGCINVTHATISNAASTIGDSVFENCKALLAIEIPSGVTLISGNMFKGCTSLASVSVASTVTSVGNSAFEGCSTLPGIILPDSITTMGTGVFKDCSNLYNPTMPKDVTAYGASLFENCSSLTVLSTSEEPGDPKAGLVIPKNVTSIGAKAFADIDSITKLTISKAVTTIGAQAFATCEIIGTVKIDTLGLTSCGAGIFEACLVEEVVFPEGITTIPANLFSKGGFRTGTTITIPATVTKVGANAFGGTNSVETNISYIVFEQNSQLETIDKQAFQYCTAITGITIPTTVTTIGQSAFLGCLNLKEITIPENVTSIGASAFSDCEVLTTIKYNAIESTIATTGSGDNKVGPFTNCNIHTITIGPKVRVLPAYIFKGAKFSTSQGSNEAVLITMEIPASVEVIGDYAFANITNLVGMEFEQDSLLNEIGAYAFYSCSALEECALPDGVATIGNAAFCDCSALEEMALPASLEYLGSSAFKNCVLITEYTIPANVDGIYDSAFYGNTALETVVFEGCNISEIGANAFAECPNLTAIDIPSGTASIGDYAFNNDASLETVKIPVSVTSIGDHAFDGCDAAEFVVVPGSYAESWLLNKGWGDRIVELIEITYVLNGGTNDPRNIGGYEEGEEFTFYDGIMPGYAFEGWYLDSAMTTRIYSLADVYEQGVTGSFTLYAKWGGKVSYRINYELNGGVNHKDNPKTYTIDSEIKFQNPTREGYTFNGWYTSEAFTSKSKVTKIEKGSYGDITLYAKWTVKKVKVTFDGNGSDSVPTPAYINVTFGGAYGTLPVVKRDGYTFDGWHTEDGKKITETTKVTVGDNHTLTARWIRLEAVVGIPVSNYETGSYVDEGTAIYLHSLTPGAQVAYTLDGSDPYQYGKLYSEAIIVTEDVTIRAYSFKEGYRKSDIVEFKYEVWSSTWGDIDYEDRAMFNDPSEIPEGIWIAGVEDTVFSGKATELDLRVYDYKTELRNKTDYTIKYANNKKVGSKTDKKAPTVTITAKGNYKGKIVAKFNILKADIADASLDSVDEVMYAIANNKVQKPVPTLKYNGVKLKNKTDFKIAYEDGALGYSAPGSYKIIVTGNGNYEGTKEIDFELIEGIMMSKVKVTGVKAYTYTGGAITQSNMVVKSGKTTLEAGKDFDVEYEDNEDVGTATITLTGKGKCYGTKKVTFKINPIATINKTKITFNKKSVTYTGDYIELNTGADPLTVRVTYKNLPDLEEGHDYVIDGYSKNKNAGTATVIFKGINGFSGTVKKTFKITPEDMTKLTLKYVTFDGEIVSGNMTYPYQKGGSKPKVYLTFNGETLREGKDYTLSYKKNTAAGMTATLTVKGKGNFKGTLPGSFTVGKQNLARIGGIAVPDVAYTGVAGKVVAKPVLTDSDGKKLAAGKDYSKTMTYSYAEDCYVMNNGKEVLRKAGAAMESADIVQADTVMCVKLTGTGNYEGSIEGRFRVVKASISKAKVSISNQVYTGKQVVPTNESINISVNGVVLDAKDYEIVSCTNNVKKGTATVTLRGKGNYGDTKTVKFKIVEKKFELADGFFLSLLEQLGF